MCRESINSVTLESQRRYHFENWITVTFLIFNHSVWKIDHPRVAAQEPQVEFCASVGGPAVESYVGITFAWSPRMIAWWTSWYFFGYFSAIFQRSAAGFFDFSLTCLDLCSKIRSISLTRGVLKFRLESTKNANFEILQEGNFRQPITNSKKKILYFSKQIAGF